MLCKPMAQFLEVFESSIISVVYVHVAFATERVTVVRLAHSVVKCIWVGRMRWKIYDEYLECVISSKLIEYV